MGERSNSEWIILNDVGFDQESFDFDNSYWDEINTNIETFDGRNITKKCMDVFGRQLCICEFMDWLNGKEIGGNTKHICYSSDHHHYSNYISKKEKKRLEHYQMPTKRP